jgi:hypothetical protein
MHASAVHTSEELLHQNGYTLVHSTPGIFQHICQSLRWWAEACERPTFGVSAETLTTILTSYHWNVKLRFLPIVALFLEHNSFVVYNFCLTDI